MTTDILEALASLPPLALLLAVAGLAFGETAILLDFVVPGEVGLVVAGAAVRHADAPVMGFALAAAFGAAAGDSLSYAIGRRYGMAIVQRFSFTRRRVAPTLEEAGDFVARHGGRSIFLGRWVGAMRAVVPFVAGVGGMRYRTFAGWNLAASLAWASSMVLLGYRFGPAVARTVDRAGSVVSLAAVAIVVTLVVVRRRRHGLARKRKRRTFGPAATIRH